MTSSWCWFIQPETAISRNRNGSRTLWVFKAHYRQHRATAGNNLGFRQIQYSDHTGLSVGCGIRQCAAGPAFLTQEYASGPVHFGYFGASLNTNWRTYAPVTMMGVSRGVLAQAASR